MLHIWVELKKVNYMINRLKTTYEIVREEYKI